MKQFVATTLTASALALGLVATAPTPRPGPAGGGEVPPAFLPAPVAGREYVVDPGPWPVVPLTRNPADADAAAAAAKAGRREVLENLVGRGVVTTVPRETRVRVSGPGVDDRTSIVSPVVGPYAGLTGCVPNAWLKWAAPRT